MTAIIPALMTISEIVNLKTQKLTIHLAASLSIGLAGVAVLMSRSLNFGGAPANTAIDTRGAEALIVASIGWSIAVIGRRTPLVA
jgi:hypothetical protein